MRSAADARSAALDRIEACGCRPSAGADRPTQTRPDALAICRVSPPRPARSTVTCRSRRSRSSPASTRTPTPCDTLCVVFFTEPSLERRGPARCGTRSRGRRSRRAVRGPSRACLERPVSSPKRSKKNVWGAASCVIVGGWIARPPRRACRRRIEISGRSASEEIEPSSRARGCQTMRSKTRFSIVPTCVDRVEVDLDAARPGSGARRSRGARRRWPRCRAPAQLADQAARRRLAVPELAAGKLQRSGCGLVAMRWQTSTRSPSRSRPAATSIRRASLEGGALRRSLTMVSRMTSASESSARAPDSARGRRSRRARSRDAGTARAAIAQPQRIARLGGPGGRRPRSERTKSFRCRWFAFRPLPSMRTRMVRVSGGAASSRCRCAPGSGTFI